MNVVQEYNNPSQLLIAVLDSINEPLCLIDEEGNAILNEEAKNLKKQGFDISSFSRHIKNNSTETVIHQGISYNLEKKDINHGTRSFVCKLIPSDDPILRLTESSKKLKKVLSAL